MTYARSYLDADNTAKDIKQSDEQISGMDWDIACALAMDRYAVKEIAHAILTCSPHLHDRKNKKEALYVTETAEKACTDPEVAKVIADKVAAQSSKESVQAQIGAGWRPA